MSPLRTKSSAGWLLALGLASACAADEAANEGRRPLEDGGAVALDAGARLGDAGSAGAVDAGPAFACDPITGAGCAAARACKLIGTPTCVREQDAPSARGAPCAPGDCAAGLACLQASTATIARCLQLCVLESGAGCGAPEEECRLEIPGLPWGACVELPPTCNPYTQRPCSPDQACQPFLRRTGARELRCLRGGPGQAGDACGARGSACGRGLVCVATSPREASCRQYCELNADCPRPEQCTGRVDDPAFTFCLP
jgi:hypothetical protein